MTLIEVAGTLLGGGGLAWVVRGMRDAYVARLKSDEKHAELGAKQDAREDTATIRTAQEDRKDRRRMEDEVRGLRDRVTALSVSVAECESKHRLAEQREKALMNELDFARQLIDRQRIEIESQREQIDELRHQFDRFVAKQMGVRLSEPPHGGAAE